MLQRILRAQQQCKAGLGHAVAVEDVRAELIDHVAHRRGGDGRAAGRDHPQTRHVELLEARMKQHLLNLRRHCEQRRHAMGLNRLQSFHGLIPTLDDVGAAHHQMRNEKRLHAADVVQRSDMQCDVGRLQSVLHHAVHRDRDVVVVAVHHALRAAGRARGVDQRRQLIARGHGAWRMNVDRLFDQRIEVMMPVRHVDRVVRARDVVVHALQALLNLQDALGQRPSVDEDAGAGIGKRVGDLAGCQSKIQRHRNRAQHLCREIGGNGILGGRHIERDPVARAHAQIGQRLCEAAHAVVPVGVRPALVFKNQRGVLRVTLDRLQENRRDVHNSYSKLLRAPILRLRCSTYLCAPALLGLIGN